jgi:glycosyltransferase involved in cell wall biosynthesis
MTRFSVIIPTRNRPGLFGQALDSVLMQQSAEFEVIVVNDGSDPAHDAAYRAIETASGERVRFLSLIRRPNGHGSSYALNTGAQQARGDYLCFLDDDDAWTDAGHLRRAAAVIDRAGDIDLYMTNQVAWVGDTPMARPVWIEDLLQCLPAPRAPSPAPDGSYAVNAEALLRAHGFCHLNTLIVRRAFFAALGGLDDGIRYENDREFYLRAIDQATAIRYMPVNVARHNVPEPARGANLSTSINSSEKRLYQLRVLDKVLLSAQRPEVRRYAMLHKTYALQHLANELARAGQLPAAAHYARQALAIRLTPKWLGTTLLYSARLYSARVLALGATPHR